MVNRWPLHRLDVLRSFDLIPEGLTSGPRTYARRDREQLIIGCRLASSHRTI